MAARKWRSLPFAVFIAALTVIFNCAESVIRPSQLLQVMDGEGFVAYLEVPQSFGTVENCWLKLQGSNRVKVELNASAEAIVTESGEEVLPFSASACGIRASKLSAASAAIWTLEAESSYGDFEQDHLTIEILPAQKKRFDTHLQLAIGDGVIACTTSSIYTKRCMVGDVNGGEWNSCNLYTAIRPNQSFECSTYNWGRMEASHEHIVVDIKNGSVISTASVTESENNVVMRCQFVDPVHSCRAVMPDHRDELFIADGLYNGRYSAYDTLTSKSRCALEVPKPLNANEIGLWRLLNGEPSTPSGCLFYIGKARKEIIEAELKILDKVNVIKVYETDASIAEIACSVPFVIDDCYLRDPNNTVHFPDNIRFERTRMYGQCLYLKMPVLAGTWTCGARGHDYEKEVLQDIQVIAKPPEGEVLTERLKVKRRSVADLMCKTPFEEPISHCVFIDPQSHVHLVASANSIKAAGHVRYYGRGMQWGECGARIEEVGADDFGEWICQFASYTGKRVTFVMRLKESVFGHATFIGLGVGVTIILLLVLGVIFATVSYRKRNLSAQHDLTSASPLDTPSTTSMQMQTPAVSEIKGEVSEQRKAE